MKILIVLFIYCGVFCLQQCRAATFAEKKKDVLTRIITRIDDVHEGINEARDGTALFHNMVCKVGVSLADWTAKIEQFAKDYQANPTPEKLLEIAAWLSDCTPADIKKNYRITS